MRSVLKKRRGQGNSPEVRLSWLIRKTLWRPVDKVGGGKCEVRMERGSDLQAPRDLGLYCK